jgi:hypothetical protein
VTTAGSSFGGAHYTAPITGGGCPVQLLIVVPQSGLASYIGQPGLILGTNAIQVATLSTIPLSIGSVYGEGTCVNVSSNAPAVTRAVVSGLITTTPPNSVPSLSGAGAACLAFTLAATAVFLLRRRAFTFPSSPVS